MYTEYVIDEVVSGHSEFDFEAAMKELLRWRAELDPEDYEDSVVFSTLEGVIDLMIDNCSF